jgi:hypothetical protein
LTRHTTKNAPLALTRANDARTSTVRGTTLLRRSLTATTSEGANTPRLCNRSSRRRLAATRISAHKRFTSEAREGASARVIAGSHQPPALWKTPQRLLSSRFTLSIVFSCHILAYHRSGVSARGLRAISPTPSISLSAQMASRPEGALDAGLLTCRALQWPHTYPNESEIAPFHHYPWEKA